MGPQIFLYVDDMAYIWMDGETTLMFDENIFKCNVSCINLRTPKINKNQSTNTNILNKTNILIFISQYQLNECQYFKCICL